MSRHRRALHGARLPAYPLRDKGGDTDWYGYCVDDPVNRVDVWGLAWSLFGGDGDAVASDGTTEQKPHTGRDDNPYCKEYPCDDNGTMQGDYKPIDIHEGALPFLLQAPDLIFTPFMRYYEKKQQEQQTKRE